MWSEGKPLTCNVWVGVARRAEEAGVAMTMPATGAAGGVWAVAAAQGWPLTMRTWCTGPAEGANEGAREGASEGASISGRCSSWGAAIMGGGGAGAMATLLGAAGFGRTWGGGRRE